MATKKLIEVALPLERINAESAREKAIRHGHPSTLHLWWARRPLAAARAVVWASLVDDPSAHPELFPTVDDQNAERLRLFKILEELVTWENSNNDGVLKSAKAEILKSTNNNPPALLDPFAGGGAIPFEAQRLGLEAHAHDLNPVAVMINKAMIEIPPRFANMPPVNPDDSRMPINAWIGTQGLEKDVRYYGDWIKKQAYKKIGHLYPQVQVPKNQGGGNATVISWFWARTVKCPNPACGCNMPLISSFVLSKKKGNEAWIEPHRVGNEWEFDVKYGKYPKEYENGTKLKNRDGKGKKGTFCCLLCGSGIASSDYIDDEANHGRMGSIPLAVAAEGARGRVYLPFTNQDATNLIEQAENYYVANDIDDKVPHSECRGTFASNAQGGKYGFFEFKDYFTIRQRIALATFSELLDTVRNQVIEDAKGESYKSLVPLQSGGSGSFAYGQAISVYLAFCIDKLADYNSAVCSWLTARDGIRNTFGRQAIPMVWDYSEANPFSNSSGCWDNMLDWVAKSVAQFPFAEKEGVALQADSQSDCGLRDIMISTDPPYYDNICYSDLSDFFYVWMRQGLKDVYPSLFRTMLVPKAEELIATPYRHDGSKEKAKDFFEEGMLSTCEKIYSYASDEIPVTIYYAYKQSDTDDNSGGQVSSGWETMLSAIIKAGFSITGTWPMRTEMANRAVASGTNALASSIVLVCRKREEDAGSCTRRNFINELKRELRPALQKLQSSNIAPVDLAQSAIGPGIGVFSKYNQVLEADGNPMTVRSALQIINQELDLYFNEQDGELDTESRFCVDLYSQMAFNEMLFGDANTLATAKNTSVAIMASHGTLFAQKGKVHLIERPELPTKIDEHEGSIWLLCQQLTYKMEKEGVEGCATAIANMYGSNAERAKDLAYRLYTIAERKKWAQEAYAYNALVVAWPEIQSRAAELKAIVPQQLTLEDFMNNNN